MLPLLSVFSLLNALLLPVDETIELEEVVLASVATLLTDPPPLLLSFDLSSSARLATLLAEPKLAVAGSSGARLIGKCDRFVLDTLRIGGGGGGFMTGGFGGGAAGRPMGLFCLAIDSDD